MFSDLSRNRPFRSCEGVFAAELREVHADKDFFKTQKENKAKKKKEKVQQSLNFRDAFLIAEITFPTSRFSCFLFAEQC